jgi:hypothetical protein
MGLRYYALGHSPSCFLDPWVLRTYNPRFCIFCMPVLDNDIQYVHCLLFRPCTFGSPASLWVELNMWSLWAACLLTASQLLQSSVNLFLKARLFFLAEVWLVTNFTGFPPVQVPLSQMTPNDLFTHNKGNANSLVRRETLVPFLANLSASSFPGFPWCPGIYTKVTLLDPITFSSAFILSHSRDDLLVVFISAAIAALLSEQICILVSFCAPQDCLHFSLKECREAAHRNTVPMVVPLPNTST